MKHPNENIRTIKRAKDYSWKPAAGVCENNKYLGSSIENSVITCDEFINPVDSVSRKVQCQQIFVTKMQDKK